MKALKANPQPQIQYWVISCFWQLSYEQYVTDSVDKWVFSNPLPENDYSIDILSISRRFDLVAILTDTAKQASKEKVIRVAVATLKVRVLSVSAGSL
jgi:V-type H+-transporting ATPase subunit H